MAQDPYKYFRVEARELLEGLTEGTHELEQGSADGDRISSLLRLAHTLKGAARVVKQPGIADLAHAIEDILSPLRDDSTAAPQERAGRMLRTLDQIRTGLAAIEQAPAQRASEGKVAVLPEVLETVRVEVDEVEALLGRLAEIGSHLAVVEEGAETAKRAKKQSGLLVQQLQMWSERPAALTAGRIRSLAEQLHDSLQGLDRQLGEGSEWMARECGQAGELANRLRLLPASAIFPVLERAVRDAAVTLGKQVEIELGGGDVRLDANVLIIMRDALLHLLRNAVAHGIETAPVRASSGKPSCGHIDFKVERRRNRVAFVCRDDGAGIDLAAVRRVAVQKGIVSAADAERLGLPEVTDIIFRGGVSTSGEVNEISGRGIGLDVVRAAISRLKGELSVETAQGRGTTVEIRVPVSLVSVLALTVGSGGLVASLPLDCVRQTLHLDAREIARCGAQESISYEGHAIPFLPLSAALGLEGPEPSPARWSTVIIASGPAMAAIGVDRLMGASTVLVRALPALAPAARTVNGAILDGKGNPQLFLDPAGLVESVSNSRRRSEPGDLSATPILVIDDSLTTRQVEQSILESAGYQVDLATSGEEGLEKARARHYELFLVDIEMPGMNGFEFISRTQCDPVLHQIPSVLVTSRMLPEDRRRGEEVGASAYIVKSEFEQKSFLETIQRLVG